jgi:hypothetical protein
MAVTYIGTPYKIWNTATQQYDTYYHLTHANAVIQTDEKKFISKTLLDFLTEIYGGGGSSVKYSDLVSRVSTNEDDIYNLKDAVNVLSAYFAEGQASEMIDNLSEILTFVNSSQIAEGTTLAQFIDSLMPNLNFNGKNIVFDEDVNFYAPTGAGNIGYILVSNGANNAPTWTNILTLSKLTLNSELILGTYSTINGNLIPITSESMSLGDITNKWLNGYIKNIYATDIQTSSFKSNGKTIDQHISANGIKSVVAKTTPPNASDYGRDNLIDGLVWIDTSGTPTGDTGGSVFSLKFKYKAPSDVAQQFDAFFNNNVTNRQTLGTNTEIPIVYFDTSLGLMALCISYSYLETNSEGYDTYEIRMAINKWNTSTQKYDIFYDVVFGINNEYSYELGYHFTHAYGYDVILPGGKILYDTTNSIFIDFPNIYTFEIVGG